MKRNQMFLGTLFLICELLLATQAQARQKMRADEIAAEYSKVLKIFDIEVSEEDLLKLPDDPKERNEALAETLTAEIHEGPQAKLHEEMRQGYLARTFDLLDLDTQRTIYQRAFEMSALKGEAKIASEMLEKGTLGNYEQNRQFICSALTRVMRDYGRMSGEKLQELANSQTSPTKGVGFTENYSRRLLPFIANSPGMSKERCSFEGTSDSSIQIRDLLRISSPGLLKELAQKEQSGAPTKLSLPSNFQGCSQEEVAFLLRKYFPNLKSAKAGTAVHVDQVYNKCQVQGLLEKESDQTFVFIAGYDQKNSPRTLYFRSSEEGARLMLALGGKVTREQSNAQTRPAVQSSVTGATPSSSRVSSVLPFSTK